MNLHNLFYKLAGIHSVFFTPGFILYFAFLAFCTSALFLVTVLFISRNRDIRQKKEKKKLYQGLESIFAQLLNEETDIQKLALGNAAKLILKKRHSRKIFLEEVLGLHSNFNGSSATRIEDFYKKTGLVNDSVKKLSAIAWYKKCEGIKELRQMNNRDLMVKMTELSYHKNVYIRQEALLALVNAGGFRTLGFMENYNMSISEWQQVSLLNCFKKFRVHELPVFSKWLCNANPAVIIFALRLIAVFKQVQSRDSLHAFIDHANAKIRTQCLATLRVFYDDTYMKSLPANYAVTSTGIKKEKCHASLLLPNALPSLIISSDRAFQTKIALSKPL